VFETLHEGSFHTKKKLYMEDLSKKIKLSKNLGFTSCKMFKNLESK
jgi:hypothetical protein